MKNRVDKTPQRSYALQCLYIHAKAIVALVEDIKKESNKKKSYKTAYIEEIQHRIANIDQYCDLFIKGEFFNDEEQRTG